MCFEAVVLMHCSNNCYLDNGSASVKSSFSSDFMHVLACPRIHTTHQLQCKCSTDNVQKVSHVTELVLQQSLDTGNMRNGEFRVDAYSVVTVAGLQNSAGVDVCYDVTPRWRCRWRC